ncbi:MAG: 4-hydroxythreonine-4-phosphate dehydrogenase PdxA [Deltaproteobacteria bacterium]|nr:4-hydroxythreonine-4-phosphate dehydrogenase PdxA [Deltaproteobacteria bacterium]MBW2019719.1 4-hydroxythreonine-4-phosphate dehydrogenase PdxA [Deltaproteobacteria bacterium]MBW2073920.1 4-hydroxythreonine-4-phosphate dehydrogenase PdxA [Deltaproteobacteria bacterium]RLB81480.1 MAG: 4-hydroxythreonine-4-phosphate dehydrogenase PdxA [Deltaproteobacteria bacterium]
MKGITKRPIIGITMGDPVGIGPEIILKALAQGSVYETCCPLVLGDIAVMTATNQWLKTGLRIQPVDAPEAGRYQSGTIDVMGCSDLDFNQLQYGHPTQETGRAMVAYVTQGIDWAMKGRIHGLATCPINKMAMHVAGFDFDGHTELLAERTKTSDYVMMLAGTRLRVALVTIHLPLAQVPQRLTTQGVFKTIRITNEALRHSFGIPRPKLAVAALNPHAGENGLFGDEEIRVISPALCQAAESGVRVSGPHPPDTLFHWALKGRWDAVVCMYHDQGLIPFKMVHFSGGVNVTLGLPIVRTSVDHGTAYDIAGTGEADPGSLVAAVRMAAQHAITRMAI